MEPVGDVAALFVELARTEATGILEVVGDEGVRTDLFLRKGVVIFAEQGTLGETLGRLLLREGALTQEQYAKVIEVMTRQLVDSEQLRFGEAAVQLGFVDPQQIHEALAQQVELKASRCLGAMRAECTLREDSDGLSRVTPFPTKLLVCVLRGMRELYFDQRLDHILFDVADQRPSLTDEGRELVAGLRLKPAENRLIAQLPDDLSVLDIIRAAADPLMVKRVLGFLHLCGALEMRVVEPPVAAAQEPKRDASVAPPEPARAPVPEAPASDREKPAPEKPAPAAPVAAPPAGSSTPDRPIGRASAIAMQIARVVGRSVPPPVSEKRARLEGEQAFAKGLALADQALWDKAYEAFHRATRCMPEALEYALHAVWAEVMTATSANERSERLQAAGIIARRAVKQEPDLAYAHYVLGNVDLEQGREDVALRRFRKAATLDPGFTDAVRHARILQRRLEKS